MTRVAGAGSRDIQAEALIGALRSGADDALNELMDIFNPSLVGYIRKTVYCDYSEAEDIAQATWTDLYEKVKNPQYKELYSAEKGSFHTYLTNCIAIYKIRQYFRESRRRPLFFASDDEGGSELEQVADDENRQPYSLVEMKYSLRLRINAYKEAFRLTFLCGGYPHQQLAFAFSKLVKGRQSPRGIEGNTAVVYGELRDIPLGTLTDMFWKAYLSASFFDERSAEPLAACLHPLRLRLGYVIGKLMELDAKSLEYYGAIKEKKARDTRFSEYLGGVPNAAGKGSGAANTKDVSDLVSNWVYKVEKRIREILGVRKNQAAEERDEDDDPVERALLLLNNVRARTGRCGHCRLRTLEPCRPAETPNG